MSKDVLMEVLVARGSLCCYVFSAPAAFSTEVYVKVFIDISASRTVCLILAVPFACICHMLQSYCIF